MEELEFSESGEFFSVGVGENDFAVREEVDGAVERGLWAF